MPESSRDLDDLVPLMDSFLARATDRARLLHREWKPEDGSPVVTVDGRWTARAWTEWTLGFFCGLPLVLFDATGEEDLWRIGRDTTLARMPDHLTHHGVHDHGFNTISSYGNLRRLLREGIAPEDGGLAALCDLAIRVSGAVQAARWTALADGSGFIHSFNGPHSLFADTIRSCRATALAHRLGQTLLGEGDRRIDLFERTLDHLRTTLRWNVYYGEGRGRYDEPGRVAHESIFSTTSRVYRCPSSQQGYSPFTTWTRGLAWVLAGCAEQLEMFAQTPPDAFPTRHPRETVIAETERAAAVTSAFYLDHCAADGVPPWDTGAPGIAADYRKRPSDPWTASEPFDSSAAAIAAQGFYRLAGYWRAAGRAEDAARMREATLRIARALLSPPYAPADDDDHRGLLLHSIYHHPNGWDHVPDGRAGPCGEASMWGDYHLAELVLLLLRERASRPLFTFFGP